MIDTHHLFVDFKADFVSSKRRCLYVAMSEFGIPAKLKRPYKLTLSNTKSSIRIAIDLSERLDNKRSNRHGDSLLHDLFNLLLEKISGPIGLNRECRIFCKSLRLLAYDDDILIIGGQQSRTKPLRYDNPYRLNSEPDAYIPCDLITALNHHALKSALETRMESIFGHIIFLFCRGVDGDGIFPAPKIQYRIFAPLYGLCSTVVVDFLSNHFLPTSNSRTAAYSQLRKRTFEVHVLKSGTFITAMDAILYIISKRMYGIKPVVSCLNHL